MGEDKLEAVHFKVGADEAYLRFLTREPSEELRTQIYRDRCLRDFQHIAFKHRTREGTTPEYILDTHAGIPALGEAQFMEPHSKHFLEIADILYGSRNVLDNLALRLGGAFAGISTREYTCLGHKRVSYVIKETPKATGQFISKAEALKISYRCLDYIIRRNTHGPPLYFTFDDDARIV